MHGIPEDQADDQADNMDPYWQLSPLDNMKRFQNAANVKAVREVSSDVENLYVLSPGLRYYLKVRVPVSRIYTYKMVQPYNYYINDRLHLAKAGHGVSKVIGF